MLYLIEILHQTTTSNHPLSSSVWLYLIEILHQTTTRRSTRRHSTTLYLIEILHQTTTFLHRCLLLLCCILLKFYIKPQLRGRWLYGCFGCILLKFYIKPQLLVRQSCHPSVVSYWNSTSNHNYFRLYMIRGKLYLIEILHQTTT